MREFRGKTAFITGGGSGIGLGMARALLGRGMNVVVADLLESHLQEARAALSGTNRLHCIRLDVSDRAAMREAARETERMFGNVHVLANNVGVSQRNPIDEAGYEDWDYVLGVNIGGTVAGLVEFLPGMKAHGEGGHVVNTSSMAGMIPVPAFAGVYAASKFAVRGLSDSLRLALAPHGIGVSVLCPGMVKTRAMTAGDLYRQAHEGDAADERRETIEGGMDPFELGETVAEAIAHNRPYIFPHGEFREEVASYFNDMLAAFPTDFELDERRAASEERRARMTAEAKAMADALGGES
ncbi:SDR family oxidoreductase [Altererythrobacter sp. B11]|uniref:SDR family oxidoreductase n=1 Tax=Altererythrobacter sp. B11 TaxID=2060312 RepID=UPI000DC6EEA1|nr:SDR family NAD(P)-dependent oxidoreductase [Altererythrobacter sp. B11]BBC72550.1 SDR family oxidoreductase [Altererythrobacter sp. B11]